MKDNREVSRFDRIKILLGQEGLDRLNKAHVMVLGLGGVGSFCTEALARGGVGRLTLIDMDLVEISNINRQAIAFESTIGRPKAQVMAEMVQQINPDCQVVADQFELTPQNISKYLGQFPKADYLVECIDLVMSKAQVAAWSQSQGIPIIASMGAANKFDPLQLTFADVFDTINCPLSKIMRREYRKVGVQQLEVLYSKELPMKIFNPISQERAYTLGTMSYMPPIMGQVLASHVIQRLAGIH